MASFLSRKIVFLTILEILGTKVIQRSPEGNWKKTKTIILYTRSEGLVTRREIWPYTFFVKLFMPIKLTLHVSWPLQTENPVKRFKYKNSPNIQHSVYENWVKNNVIFQNHVSKGSEYPLWPTQLKREVGREVYPLGIFF